MIFRGNNDLRQLTDLAQEIGFLTIYSSNLDYWMMPAMVSLMRNKPEVPIAVLSNVDSLSAKFEIFISIVKAREGVPLANDLLPLISGIKAAIKYRNKLAHGLYAFSHDGHPAIIPFAFSAKNEKPKSLNIKPADVKKHTDSIQTFIKVIVSHVGHAHFGIPEKE